MGGRGAGGGGGGGTSGSGGGGRADGDLGRLLEALRQQSHQQQQLLQALGSGAQLANGQRGGRRGGADSRAQRQRGRNGGGGGGQQQWQDTRSATGTGAQQHRPGDWQCRECQFSPNFGARQRCFGCGAPRRRAEANAAGGLAGGPIGANGLRPVLAWGTRGGDQQAPPTRRTPGASVAAIAEAAAAAAAGSQAREASGRRAACDQRSTATLAAGGAAAAAKPPPAATSTSSSSGGGATGVGGGASTPGAGPGRGGGQAHTDEDGFTEVVGRRRGAARLDTVPEPTQDGPTTAAVRAGQAPLGSAGKPAGGHEEDDDDGMDVEEELDGGAGEEGDDGGEDEETPEVLKQKLDQEAAMVQWLTREGVAEDHPSMVAAVRAREAAEQRWKEARRPQPVAKRMGWTQAKLDRALRQQGRVVEELANFDHEVKMQRQKIVQKLEAARDKVSRHRQALEDLQEEAGALAPSARRGGAGGAVCAQVASGLRETVAPSVNALAATIPEGTAARSQLEALMGHLTRMQQQLEGATDGEVKQQAPPPPHEAFNIADGERSDAEWSESHELGDASAPTAAANGISGNSSVADGHWQAKGHGRWGKGAGDAMGTGAGGTGDGGERRPTARRIVDGEQAAVAHGERGSDAEGDPRAAKHRRGQAAEDSADAAAAVQETRNAVEIRTQQAAAANAAALQLAGQQYAQRVSEVTRRAIERGIQPITEQGQDLIMLGPSELDAWVATHLGGEGA